MGKILFIVNGYPIYKHAGSIFYERLLLMNGKENFCYFSTLKAGNMKLPQWLLEIPHMAASPGMKNKKLEQKIEKTIPMVKKIYYRVACYFISKKIEKFAKDNDVTLILASLRLDVLGVINKINRKGKLPFLVYIPDTVEAEFTNNPHLFKYKTKEYYKAIRKADGVFVAGETMEEYIRTNFRKKTALLRMPYEANHPPEKPLSNCPTELKIFFAGTLYAWNEIDIFIKALAAFADKHPEFNITLTTATKRIMQPSYGRLKMEHLGWTDEKYLTDSMKTSTIAYLPYCFDEKHRMQMSHAFPSKAGYYLSTGLPIFFHGPVYASMAKFFEKYSCGIHCSSMDIEAIVTNLEKILFDTDFYNSCRIEAKRAFNKEFTTTVFKGNFSKLEDGYLTYETN